MHRYYTPGRRLLNFLMDAGGCLTLWQIARKSAGGRLLANARPELQGLIVEEKGKTPNRGQRSGRPCTRVFLTMRGWAACAALRTGWEPRRLSVTVLKEWLAELQEERDPWAVSLHEMPPKQFEKMREDSKELARLKEAKWIRPPLRRFGPKPGIQPANGFQRLDGSSPAAGRPVPPRGPSAPIAPRPLSPAPPQQSQPRPLSSFEEALRLQNQVIGSSRQPERFVQNLPKTKSDTDRAEEARILARFNGDPWGGELLPDGKTIRYNNRNWTLQGWEKERFRQAG